MLKLTETYFAQGMAELTLFFPRFKPTAKQIAAWYARLNHFTEKELELAIFAITEQDMGPSYEMIKTNLFKARAELTEQPREIPTAQGFAPYEHLKDFASESMTMLFKILSERREGIITKEQARIRLNDLKYLWKSGYKNLTGYKSAEQIQELINNQNWNELKKIGFLTQEPEDYKAPFVRGFTAQVSNGLDDYEL